MTLYSTQWAILYCFSTLIVLQPLDSAWPISSPLFLHVCLKWTCPSHKHQLYPGYFLSSLFVKTARCLRHLKILPPTNKRTSSTQLQANFRFCLIALWFCCCVHQHLFMSSCSVCLRAAQSARSSDSKLYYQNAAVSVVSNLHISNALRFLTAFHALHENILFIRDSVWIECMTLLLAVILKIIS